MLSRPYQNRWNNQTYVVNDRPTLDTGGGGAAAAVTAPLYPGQGSAGAGGGSTPTARPMFQQSLSKERAMNAFRAGTFAANAAPAMPGQSAYGSDQNAAAGRKAFVASQMAQANSEDFGNGPNVFENSAMRGDQNARENASNAAAVQRTGAEAGKLKAEGDDLTLRGRVLYPGQAAESYSRADRNRSDANATDKLLPGRIAGQAADTTAKYSTASRMDAQARATDAGTPELQQRFKDLTKQHDAAQKRIMQLENQLGKKNGYPTPPPPEVPIGAAGARPAGPVSGLYPGASATPATGLTGMVGQPGSGVASMLGAPPPQSEPLPTPTPQVPTPVAAAAPAGNPLHTPENLAYTAKQHGIGVDEVKRRLGIA